MKRFASLALTFLMVFALTAPALASNSSTWIKGTPTEQRTDLPETRAVSVPTRMAPDSWYGVDHKWTAKYYTWSSYIFEGKYNGSFRCWAQQPFTVEIYLSDGTFWDAGEAEWNSYDSCYEVDYFWSRAMNYYVKIINDGTSSILNDAYYQVSQGDPF